MKPLLSQIGQVSIMLSMSKKKYLHQISFFVEPQNRAENLFKFKKVSSQIKDQEGEDIFFMKSVEVPEAWSQVAVDVVASKYLRKSGVGLLRGSEKSVKQLVDRVVDSITASGREQGGYFRDRRQSEVFKEELKYLIYSQSAAFNSPVWFNVGLWEKYGLKSKSEHYYWDSKKKKVLPLKNTYEHPQCSACFIQKVGDSIEEIFALAGTEARLFKYGSGTGTNFSALRSKYEMTNSGGLSSGLISFLEVLDKGAGAIKSGGITRRAAKMVVVNADHPEVMEFIDWKKNEERKAQALLAAGFSGGMDGEAYRTVSGQNANNSVRVTDEFMRALVKDGEWSLKSRATGKTIKKLKANEVMNKIAESAWACAEPGMQFHSTINEWHTCEDTSEIQASNPCSEYMFIDDSACNLASLNLVKFLKTDGSFDFEAFIHATKTLITAQDMIVDYSSYPTVSIAQNSHDYRPLGIGFANLGSLMMHLGLPYDSDAARAWAAAIASLMTGIAYYTSAELAGIKGPFAEYKKNKKSMLAVIQKHKGSLKHINWKLLPDGIKVFIDELWEGVSYLGARNGFRNSQVSVIAPTGTIGLMMDCDTTGIEPEFSLIKTKKLSGGGFMKLANQAVEHALIVLNYTDSQITEILKFIEGHNSIEKAPHLKMEHYAIFDCATAPEGHRYLSVDGHLKMMAAVQPFISGAISKTVNLPRHATVEEVRNVFIKGWDLGLKAVAIYRDGSKMAQPLNSESGKSGLSSKDQASEQTLALNADQESYRASSEKGFGGPSVDFRMICPECGTETQLESGCYRCPNCGVTSGCA